MTVSKVGYASLGERRTRGKEARKAIWFGREGGSGCGQG
jgi:hypothetical protein